jgi:hypothetical protein
MGRSTRARAEPDDLSASTADCEHPIMPVECKAYRLSYARRVSFVQPSDPDYLHAKRIKQGQSRVDPVYDAFVERFRERYGILPRA